MTATTLRGKWSNSVQIQYQDQNQKKLAAMAWFICMREIAFMVGSGCHVKVYALDVLQPRTLAASLHPRFLHFSSVTWSNREYRSWYCRYVIKMRVTTYATGNKVCRWSFLPVMTIRGFGGI